MRPPGIAETAREVWLGMARRLASLAIFLAMATLILWSVAPQAAGAPSRLLLQLPHRAVHLAISPRGGAQFISLVSLAQALEASVQEGPGGSAALIWAGRRIVFTPNQRQAATASGTATLSAPARLRGARLWLPVDAAAAAARERFGADQVRWNPRSRTITVVSAAAQIRDLRIGWHADRVRVVLEAVRTVEWSVKPGEGGHLVISLPGSALSLAITRREFREGPLRAVEPIQGSDGAQVRLALAGRADRARWFALEHPFRIVVDLDRSEPRPGPGAPTPPRDPAAGNSARGTAAAPPPGGNEEGRPEPAGRAVADAARAVPTSPAGPAAAPQTPEAPPRPAPSVPLTIVLDPGHGGKDTGAIGPRGLKEKDVVLDIALRLRQPLVDRLGARVILTRSDDTFIPLEERTAIANKAQADFFISIHVNSALQARASGVETYYLSREPSDGDARASAARENLALNLEGIGPREQEGLKAILWDMAQTLHLRESSALAEMLMEDLARGLRKETRGVKHGPFVVLMTAGMPSVLVEVGFISNPHEERRLQEESYRRTVAETLAQGIGKYAGRYQRRIGMRPALPGRS